MQSIKKPHQNNQLIRARVRDAASRPVLGFSHLKVMEIAKDPKKAEAFLIDAGIITKAGKLAPEYAA